MQSHAFDTDSQLEMSPQPCFQLQRFQLHCFQLHCLQVDSLIAVSTNPGVRVTACWIAGVCPRICPSCTHSFIVCQHCSSLLHCCSIAAESTQRGCSLQHGLLSCWMQLQSLMSVFALFLQSSLLSVQQIELLLIEWRQQQASIIDHDHKPCSLGIGTSFAH